MFKCSDKYGTIVECSKDCWENHIVAEHPEMRECEAVVQTAIEKPYRIYQDPRHPNTKIFYKPFVLPEPFHTHFVRIAIEYKEKILRGRRGYVKTAFACVQVRKGDILIWEEKI